MKPTDLWLAIVVFLLMLLIVAYLRYRDADAAEDPTAGASMQVHPPGIPWRFGMRVAM